MPPFTKKLAASGYPDGVSRSADDDGANQPMPIIEAAH
jgi:hypothetical protein